MITIQYHKLLLFLDIVSTRLIRVEIIYQIHFNPSRYQMPLKGYI